ncbi:MAG TPA: hypothetical protein VMT88_01880 [Actinomycetes bacterium]|nr:hypothetical protein [Actinomycetes bacterium]
MDGKGLMLGVIVLSLALWGVLMFSLSSDQGGDETQPPPCIAEENC